MLRPAPHGVRGHSPVPSSKLGPPLLASWGRARRSEAQEYCLLPWSRESPDLENIRPVVSFMRQRSRAPVGEPQQQNKQAQKDCSKLLNNVPF